MCKSDYSDDYELVASEIDEYLSLFIEGLEQSGIDDVVVNHTTVLNLSQSFCDDMVRYARYHKIEVPDRARRAAYMCKWIAKMRPISFEKRDDDIDLPDEAMRLRVLANEHFAVFVAESQLKYGFAEHLSDRTMNLLMYSLRFRQVHEDYLIPFFYHISEDYISPEEGASA